MKEKLTDIWLWAVALVVSLIMACTFMAWIASIAVLVARFLNA